MTPRDQALSDLSRADPKQGGAFANACYAALDLGLYEEVETRLQTLTHGSGHSDPALWQLLGIARRSLQDSAGAYDAFVQAARHSPADPLLAHSVARTALEAGYPSAQLFARAAEMSPRDGQVLLGLAAAMLAQGDAPGALDLLQRLLDQNPGWHQGHSVYAKIAAITAGQIDPLASLHKALTAYRKDPNLWVRLVEVAMQADDYRRALECITQAREAVGPMQELDRAEAIARNESGDPEGARAIFQRLPEPANSQAFAHLLRNLIRLGEFSQASSLADRHFAAAEEVHIWPYRALIWRLTGDPRWDWLEGEPRLVGTYDIGSQLDSLPRLSEVLRAIHGGTGAPIDQSVRGGTQTDGNILARAEPEIRQLRRALLEAVRCHIAQLPAPIAGHPTLIDRREPIRIEGAWSVRLVSEGFHVDHVHPLGWFSSAFYAALPEGDGGIGRTQDNQAGWLTLGECRTLAPDLPAFRTIEPKVGTLALFPSTMWHGTRKFGAGERMTVALDIQRPPQ